MEEKIFSLDAVQLQQYQPNVYPFLLIDRVTEVCPGKYAKGFKNLTNNEWFFPGHFKGNPNMPACLQIEAMAQMLTVALLTVEGMEDKVVHGYRHDAVFHREVKPGDRLEMEAMVKSFKRGLCRGSVIGKVDGEKACELDTVLIIPDIFSRYRPAGKK